MWTGFTFVRRLGDFSEDIEAGLLKISHERFVEDQSKEKSEAMKETQGEMHAVKDMQQDAMRQF